MAAVTTITYVAKLGSQLRVGFKVALSGSYPPGGETINFATAAQDANFQGMAAAVEALGAPLSLDMWSNGGNITTFYSPVLGTTPANSKMKVATALATEVSAGTYAANAPTAAADTICGEATFNNL